MKQWIFSIIIVLYGTMCSQSNPDRSYEQMRENMIEQQIKARGIKDQQVLEAIKSVERHEFVPEDQRQSAYADSPLPIGHGQTISQPYIVAYMTEQLNLQADEKVLEIGTGSGYQAAVLAHIVSAVYTIEIVKPLCEDAKKRLKRLKYENIHVMCGDGYKGWPKHAPFDAVILTAAAKTIPQPLIDQLAVGGRLIAPVGELWQELILLKRLSSDKVEKQKLIPVRFVPLTGDHSK